MKTILFLSNQSISKIKNDPEFTSILSELKQSEPSNKYNLQPQAEFRIEKIQTVLRKYKPKFFHLSSFVNEEKFLLSDKEVASSEGFLKGIKDSFGIFQLPITCALFNLNNSEALAEAVAYHVDYAIGTTQDIFEEDGINFSSSFYQSISQNEAVIPSFIQGVNNINLATARNSIASPYVLITKKFKKVHSSKSLDSPFTKIHNLEDYQAILRDLKELEDIEKNISEVDSSFPKEFVHQAMSDWFIRNKESILTETTRFVVGDLTEEKQKYFKRELNQYFRLILGCLKISSREPLEFPEVEISFEPEVFHQAFQFVSDRIELRGSYDKESADFLKNLFIFLKRRVF